jgi:hypothetical protein
MSADEVIASLNELLWESGENPNFDWRQLVAVGRQAAALLAQQATKLHNRGLVIREQAEDKARLRDELRDALTTRATLRDQLAAARKVGEWQAQEIERLKAASK